MREEVAIVGWRLREDMPVSWRRGGMEGPAVAVEGVRVVGVLWKRWAGRRSVMGPVARRVLSMEDRWALAVAMLALALLVVVFEVL
jgi:hypothetical protein